MRGGLAVLLVLAGVLTPIGASAQDSSRVTEIYHIFDFKTTARRAEIIKALQDGLNPNVAKSNTMTPIVMGAPPEKPARFTIVNPFENANFPLGGMIPPAQLAMAKQARCDGAVWISSAVRKTHGSQRLSLTMCLFPYVEGYQLDVYAIDAHERGGGISAMVGRAVGEAIVGKPEGWTNKTILDVVRSVRRVAGVEVSYVEGQPEFTGTPWEDGVTLTPSRADKATVDTAPAPGGNK